VNTPQASFEKTFAKDVFQSSTVHVNFGQEFIVTTEDKLRLCMLNHANRLGDRNSWIGPTSLFVTIVLVLLTADFRDALGVPKSTWHAVFLISAVATAVWSVATGYRAWNTTSSIEEIVSDLKRTSQSTPTPQSAQQLTIPDAPLSTKSE